MDQESTSSILFISFFILLIPLPLYSLHGNDVSASIWKLSFQFMPFSMKNVTFHCHSAILNKSFPLSSAAAVFVTLFVPFQEVNANSSASFGTEFSFSVQASNGPAFFTPSEKLLLHEQVLSVEFGPLMISKDVLEFKNGKLATTVVFYHRRHRCLTVGLPYPRKWIKKSDLSAKFILEKRFLPFMYVNFSASKKVGNITNLVAKFKSFKTFGSQPENYGKKDVVLGIYTPVLALISIISAILTYLKKLFTIKKVNPQIPSQETPASTKNSVISNLLVGFQKFTYMELSAATNSFHQSELLGIGLYASVYRAILPESNTIYAVKRFNQNVSSKTSFQIEVTAIHRLRHDKILELRGWCDENPDEPMLVYDYMPNKCLEKALLNRNQPLLWPQRYKIAVGVAEALVYLHEECLPMVIHGDIKEGNVMLDADFNPKLGDFGLAMSFPPYVLWRGRTEQDPPECQLDAEVTEKIDVYLYGLWRGRTEQDPPECQLDAEVTEKIDVYLYGSMVLGLCCQGTGRLNIFSKLLKNMKLAGKLLHAVDKRLEGSYNEEEMLRLLNVGLLCLEEEFQKRPSMKQVLKTLTSQGGTEESDLSSPIETST